MASTVWKRVLGFKKTTKEDKESSWFIKNETKLLNRFLAASNTTSNVPYRVFTVKELIKATNENLTRAESNFSMWAMSDSTGYYIKGSFQQRPILVKKFHSLLTEHPSYVINDMVISLQMNHHKNVLKVLGCCLDFEVPIITYDHANNDKLLSEILFNKNENISLTWSNRLKIATDIANVVVHLHTEFCTPIIHRNLGTKNVVIDQNGVAKLVDFSLCIPLPPGESEVADMVIGTKGQIDPEYAITGIVSKKSDVYMFGVILQELLTSKRSSNSMDFQFDSNQLNNIGDSMILGETRETERAYQLKSFAELAMKCTQYNREDRPDMIDVAKELRQIERSCHPD